MKLLLSSAGLTNRSLIRAMENMAGKQVSDLTIAFIPTASMIETDDKGWFIDELNCTYELGWKEFLIVELMPGCPRETILEQLEKADVIYGCGGNEYFLASKIMELGISKDIRSLLDSKVYVGSSAGSMIFTNHVDKQAADIFGDDWNFKIHSFSPPFGLFDWYIKPHYRSPLFTERTEQWASRLANSASFPIYFLDDQSAVRIDGDLIEVVSEGEWKYYE